MSVVIGRRCFKLLYFFLYKIWYFFYVYKRVLCVSFMYFNINEIGYKLRNNYIYICISYIYMIGMFFCRNDRKNKVMC